LNDIISIKVTDIKLLKMLRIIVYFFCYIK